jgi:hypothetical protein
MFNKLQKVLDGMGGGMYGSPVASANILKNTLQASPMVRRRDAQTGGFIFLQRALRDNPADHFVGCGEVRTASAFEAMRFIVFTASYDEVYS